MRTALAGLVLALLTVPGCGEADGDTLTVLAAASLTEPFEELAGRFEAEHPGVEVELAFDSSATLAQQAVEGAPADVLATADTATMDSASDALAAGPAAFATNTMVLVTPAGNPAGVTAVSDLQSGDAAYVVCVETAPCGKVAQELLASNAITVAPVSLEVDVKAVLAKVTSDEADAGLVYASDAVSAGDRVERFEVAGADERPTTYSIARLQQAGDPGLAQDFVDLVLASEGQDVMAAAGFAGP